ncbi:MAG TPA: acyltransferase family protein, partial [Prolixibacteraceae bacterium]
MNVILNDQRLIKSERLIWPDLIKAIALLAIFLNHLVERIFGFPYIGNPDANWPAFQQRLAQLEPLKGFGGWNLLVNLLRYAGWFGEHGVEIFLLISGFGLTWNLLAQGNDKGLNLKRFYVRRAKRVFPLWWLAHLIFITLWVITGWGL